MKAFKYYSACFFIVISLGCRSDSREAKKLDQVPQQDSVVHDIPNVFQSESWNQYFSSIQSSLNLRPLREGFSEWQIRLWISHGVYDSQDSAQLLVFSKEKGRYSGIIFTYITQEDKDNSSDYVSTSGNFYTLFPKSSNWEKFAARLDSLDVFTLPNYTEIGDYYLASDSYGVTIEVAKKGFYRIYGYPDYEAYTTRIPQVAKLLCILKLVEKEFGVRVIY